MNDLVILNDSDVPVTTSLLVAEKFERQHSHVMESTRMIVGILEDNKKARSEFRLCSRIVGGREFPMFEMTRKGFAQLVGSFDGEKATLFRKDYADAFDAMEEELKKQKEPNWEIPKTFAEALLLAGNQAMQLETQAPKVKAFETYLSTENSMTFTEVAKSLGFKSATALCSLLRDDGVLFKELKTGTKNMPIARYAKYFDMTRVVPEGRTKSYPQTRVTPEGHEWMRKRYVEVQR